MPQLPLEGIRVLDSTYVFALPYTGGLLADFGAEVIKIEGPAHPDTTRNSGLAAVSSSTSRLIHVPPNPVVTASGINVCGLDQPPDLQHRFPSGGNHNHHVGTGITILNAV